MHKIFAAER